MREIGEWAQAFSDISSIFLDSSGNLLSQINVRKNLLLCNVFAMDIEEKKMQLLLQKMSSYKTFEGLVGYCQPAIDYHLIRTYLRRGLLFAKTEYAKEYIMNQTAERKESTVAAVRHLCAELLGQLQKDFIFYKEMNKQLSDESIWTEDNPHTIVDVGPFYLLILNTALTACSNADNKRLMIGSVFIDACVSRVNDGKPIIAMGHHGFDWLRDEENHVCTKFLDNHNISLYLCGHSHEHWFSSFGEKGKQVNVGCFVQDNSDVYAGFAIVIYPE